MPIADSDSDDELSENENTNGDSDESSEWENVTERDDIFQQIKFTVSPKVTGPQISPNIIEPIDIFKLFFTDELVDNIIKETNNYANTKISAKRLTKRSIWNNWKNLEKEEFCGEERRGEEGEERREGKRRKEKKEER